MVADIALTIPITDADPSESFAGALSLSTAVGAAEVVGFEVGFGVMT